MDYQIILISIAQLVVPNLADWCTIHIVDETGTTRQLAVAHVDSKKVAWANELERHYPHNPNAARGVAQVIRTARSELYQDIPDTVLVEFARDPNHLQLLREVGYQFSHDCVTTIARAVSWYYFLRGNCFIVLGEAIH